uniref:Uncharacterized protein n=1 Tax=Romanomermis culicivorax TaxID=13658 RepID=A0A915IR80_ROMCU
MLSLPTQWPASPSHRHGVVCWCAPVYWCRRSDNASCGVAELTVSLIATCVGRSHPMHHPKSAQTTPTTPSAPLCETKDPFGHPSDGLYTVICDQNQSINSRNTVRCFDLLCDDGNHDGEKV